MSWATMLLGASPMAIAGIGTRYVLAALVVLIVVILAAAVLARRRGPALELRKLDGADARRYLETFAAAETEFEARPQVAVAQARGIVEEVLRRIGFPDRVESAQKARDLAGHDRAAAAALKAADQALGEGSDRESLRRALNEYREVLDRLLADTEGG
jgi:hypothetical protein